MAFEVIMPNPPGSPVERKHAGRLLSSGKSCAFLCVFCLGAILLLLLNAYLLVSLDPSVKRSLSQWSWGANQGGMNEALKQGSNQRLAVVVPTHAGDLAETLTSLENWPTTCSSDTLTNVDLVIYKAEAEDEATEREALPRFRETAGKCFANTRIVYGGLTKEENVYPTGASVQFYKMYLDQEVKSKFAVYDVIGIIEHDVVVARDDSFSQLYRSAFPAQSSYWVKGSVLAGKNFHETATVNGLWHVLGHINGNALYNNTDSAFADFVNYTRTRWSYALEPAATTQEIKYRFPYDVALWATIADFPYSWPLWQRFSEKFVNSHLISNVGFIDADQATVSDAVTRDTLFIHGSSTAGGSKKFAGAVAVNLAEAYVMAEGNSRNESNAEETVCMPACSMLPQSAKGDVESGVHRVCDPSCLSGEQGVRFGGYLCGAGDLSTFGKGCRTCYTDIEKAAAAERELRSEESAHGDKVESEEDQSEQGKHVIMCDTLRPPPSSDCSTKCHLKLDTVCDHTCGTGRFGDYNCNWRDHGTKCRYCFNDVRQALKADKIARRTGGRVIMCHTHEPPQRLPTSPQKPTFGKGLGAGGPKIIAAKNSLAKTAVVKEKSDHTESLVPNQNLTVTPFAENIVRGDMCAFIPGYFKFIAETEVTVQSVFHFMRGMRVVVATHPHDFPAYQRTLGRLPGVRLVETDYVGTSGLLADKYCGEGTKLIYYMNVGELFSRTMNFKDTHSPRGDLLVVYSDHVQATAAILGFSSPSFGPDIMLPVEINAQLRQLVVEGHGQKNNPETSIDDDEYPVLLLSKFADVSVPQMLAAVAYSRNPEGIWFFNPSQWVDHHLFKDASIWDIPLVKPRFSCLLDMSLAARGYDMGLALRKVLGHFKAGATCETGFRELKLESMRPNPNIEFSEATGNIAPDIKTNKISVMYSLLGNEDETIFETSLSSVIKHFPGAFEVVLVTGTKPKPSLGGLVDRVSDSAEFPVRFVTDTASGDAAMRENPSRMRSQTRFTADHHCDGDYVLYLDSTMVLVANVTYEAVFHFGQPVIPYKRPVEGEWEQLVACRANETALVFDEPLRHQFNMFNSIVYPRKMFAKMREFIGRLHGSSFDKVMSRIDRSWAIPGDVTRCSLAERELVLPDFEFMGAFLWHEMHDAVYWLATDPRDLHRDDWAVDYFEFAWTCTAHSFARVAVEDAELVDKYVAELESVDSPIACWRFNTRWES